MSRQTLIETQLFTLSPQAITEAVKTERGNLLVEGRLQAAETKNGNGRYYPRKILEREVENYKKGPIAENRALGELDHPDSSVVELKNVSHIVREAYMKGDDVYGKIEILDTPSGKIIQSLIESGVTLGISSRGVGSTKRQGDTQIVQDDFQLICFDMVSEPSTPGAFMMKEAKDYENKVFTKADKINRLLNEVLSEEE